MAVIMQDVLLQVQTLDLLLGLLHGLQLPLSSPLRGLRTSLSVEKEIPPPEAARIVSDKALVVYIVMLGTRPEGKEMVQAPGKLVSTVRIDGLEQTENNPEVHGENMQVTRNSTPKDRPANRAET